jgi:hypothetical protein
MAPRSTSRSSCWTTSGRARVRRAAQAPRCCCQPAPSWPSAAPSPAAKPTRAPPPASLAGPANKSLEESFVVLGSASLLRPGQQGHSSESAVGGLPRPRSACTWALRCGGSLLPPASCPGQWQSQQAGAGSQSVPLEHIPRVPLHQPARATHPRTTHLTPPPLHPRPGREAAGAGADLRARLHRQPRGPPRVPGLRGAAQGRDRGAGVWERGGAVGRLGLLVGCLWAACGPGWLGTHWWSRLAGTGAHQPRGAARATAARPSPAH